MLNVQSIRNKTEDLLHNIMMSNYGVCIITETWLCNDAGDETLVAQLKVDGYDFLHSPWNGTNRGGGLEIFFKKSIKVSVINKHIYSTFEMCIWDVTCRNINVIMVGVYRPPYSTKNRNTVSKFLAEFSEVVRHPWIISRQPTNVYG